MAGPWEAFSPPADTGAPADGPWTRMTDAPTRITVRPQDAYQDQGPPQEPISGPAAAGVGAVQGATFEFGDELAGLMSAGTAGMSTGQQRALVTSPGAAPLIAPQLIGLARLGYEALTRKPPERDTASLITGEVPEAPKGEAMQAFDTGRDRWRATVERAKTLRPYSYGAGNIAGSVAAPVGVAAAPVRAVGAVAPKLLSRAGGRELLGRSARGTVTGMAVGGLSGVGEGTDLESRAEKGAVGTAVGGAIGAAAPVAFAPIEAVAKPVGRAIASRYRSVFKPTEEAERRVLAAKEADIATDPTARNRMTNAEATAARAEGEPVMLMDTGGEEVRGLARSAANQSPQARARLEQELVQRSKDAPVRYSDRLQQMTTYTPQKREQMIREVSDQVYEPRYAKAWRDARGTPLWDDTLEELAQAPQVQNAIRVANSKFRNWSALDHFPVQQRDTLNIFKLEPGLTSLIPSKSGKSTRLPSLQLWDYVKRALDQSGDPTSSMFAKAIRSHLDTLVPSYKAARESASHIKFFEGAPNAYEAGKEFLNKGVPFGAEARQRLKSMDPREQDLFRDGYIQQVVDRIEATGRLDSINRISRSRGAREEMEAALGPQRYREVESMVRLHDLMERANTAMRGNSTTARQIIEYGLVSGSGSYGAFTGDPTAITAATLVAGRRAINERMARKVSELLIQNDPASFQKAAQLVARDQSTFDKLRALGMRLATRLAPPNAPKTVGAYSGRADTPDSEAPLGPAKQ